TTVSNRPRSITQRNPGMNRIRSLRWALLAAVGLIALPAGAADTNPTDADVKAVVDKAAGYLRKTQAPDGSWSAKSTGPGVTAGVGYDGKSRPDLSNTQFFVDALLASGVPKDDPAIKDALKFITKCQNLPGEGQKQPFAQKAVGTEHEGGFTYTPIDPDDSKHK